jgi:hypothetical protein
MDVQILTAQDIHQRYAEEICHLMEVSAHERKTGIAKRSPDYIRAKMAAGNAIIALDGEQLVGFCYIETWSHGKYVANSGLIVAPAYRKAGMARGIKKAVFNLARNKYPEAKVFGITTSLAVMKINTELGYQPVTFSELTQDQAFWDGCKSCPNYEILERNERRLCLCTGMLAPSKVEMEKDLSHLILVAHEKQ